MKGIVLGIGLLLAASCLSAELSIIPAYIWLEAEHFAPLRGGNFSYQHEDKTTRGSWSLAGPGVAAEWTMGGESEWMSIAARGDETNEVKVSHPISVPVAASYRLLVRYADYRNKREEFGVRIQQNGKASEHIFGREPRIDELDPMKLLWDWSFAWDEATFALDKGSGEIEIFTTGPTQARRAIDCLCLTTDPAYHPLGREKPDFAVWRLMRSLHDGQLGIGKKPVGVASIPFPLPKQWTIASEPPGFLWNVDAKWLQEIAKVGQDRDRSAATNAIDDPFGVDPPLSKDFLATFRGKRPPVYSDPLSVR